MITQGWLLGGQVRHDQPKGGHRSGIEPVLLAASVPARPGQNVLEGGSGAGAALLCLAHRVPGVNGLGVEREPALAALATANAEASGVSGLRFVAADLTAWEPAERFDHAMANPPWHGAGTASPDRRHEAARRAEAGLLARWAMRLAGGLRHRGTLTLALGAAHLADGLAALGAAGCGSLAVLPLWPRPGRAAKLVLLRAVRGGRGPSEMLPGLVLHRADGGFTAEAEAVLRGGAALPFK